MSSVFLLCYSVILYQVVNHSDEPLRENPVVQFITIQGSTWKGIEHIYEGFKGGIWGDLIAHCSVNLSRVVQGQNAVWEQ